LYFHGGGFVMGTLDTHDSVARRLTTESRVIVVSVGYRRAPEARFPAACKDCWAALEWVAEVGPSLGGDPDRIGVAGDSAGGNLAIGVGMRSRGNDGPTVAHTALIYPITDFSFSTASYDEYADGYGFNTRATMRWCWDKYLDDDLHGENPYASPLRARDLTGFPPTIMVTAELDPLRDEGLAFASRLEAAGVPVTSRTYDGMIHGFVNMLAAPEIPHASDALELIAEEMAAWL
jgi:acetyl esterase